MTLPEGKCTITAKQDFMSASDSLDIDVDDLRPTNINVVYSNPTNVFLARMALILGALGIASLFRILFGWSQYGFLGLAYVLMIAGMLAIKKLQFNHISLSIDEDLHP